MCIDCLLQNEWNRKYGFIKVWYNISFSIIYSGINICLHISKYIFSAFIPSFLLLLITQRLFFLSPAQHSNWNKGLKNPVEMQTERFGCNPNSFFSCCWRLVQTRFVARRGESAAVAAKKEGRAEASKGEGGTGPPIFRSTEEVKRANSGWPYTGYLVLNREMDTFLWG